MPPNDLKKEGKTLKRGKRREGMGKEKIIMGKQEGKRAKEIENYAEYNAVFSNKRGGNFRLNLPKMESVYVIENSTVQGCV